MEQRFEMKTETTCEKFIGVPRKAWQGAPKNFHYQLECIKKETPQKP